MLALVLHATANDCDEGDRQDRPARNVDERDARETGERYITIFKTSLIAMSFYDANQCFIDANDQMRKISGINVLGEDLYRQTRLTDMPILKDDFSPESHEDFHVCQHLVIPQANIDIYIEFRVFPVVNNNRIIFNIAIIIIISTFSKYF